VHEVRSGAGLHRLPVRGLHGPYRQVLQVHRRHCLLEQVLRQLKVTSPP
jgi:hypothetical protein